MSSVVVTRLGTVYRIIEKGGECNFGCWRTSPPMGYRFSAGVVGGLVGDGFRWRPYYTLFQVWLHFFISASSFLYQHCKISSQTRMCQFIWQRFVKVLAYCCNRTPLSTTEYLWVSTLLHLANVNCLQLSKPSNKLPVGKTCQKQHIAAQLNIYNHYYCINIILWVSWISS